MEAKNQETFKTIFYNELYNYIIFEFKNEI